MRAITIDQNWLNFRIAVKQALDNRVYRRNSTTRRQEEDLPKLREIFFNRKEAGGPSHNGEHITRLRLIQQGSRKNAIWYPLDCYCQWFASIL